MPSHKPSNRDGVPQDGVPPYEQIVTGHFYSRKGYRGYRPDGSGDWLLIYTADGVGEVCRAADTYHTTPGQLLLFKPGTPHDYGVEESRAYWELLWAHFQLRPQWMTWINWPQVLPGILMGELKEDADRDRVKALLIDMNNICSLSNRQTHQHAQDLAMNLLEQVLLWCNQSLTRSGETAIDRRIRTAIDFASTHLTHVLDVDTLARQAGLSPSRFAHLFRQELGDSPQRYVEQLRIRRAKQLLARAGLSVKEVASQVGFADPFYFANRFKKVTGQSPTQYRRQGRAT